MSTHAAGRRRMHVAAEVGMAVREHVGISTDGDLVVIALSETEHAPVLLGSEVALEVLTAALAVRGTDERRRVAADDVLVRGFARDATGVSLVFTGLWPDTFPDGSVPSRVAQAVVCWLDVDGLLELAAAIVHARAAEYVAVALAGYGADARAVIDEAEGVVYGKLVDMTELDRDRDR